PQDTPIPTGDPNDAARPQIASLDAPSEVRPGQVVTLRLTTNFSPATEISSAAVAIDGIEGWFKVDVTPTPGTVSDTGAWVFNVRVTVAESPDDDAVARLSVALLSPDGEAGGYRTWAPALMNNEVPVECPRDAACDGLMCGPDPICGEVCGACTPSQGCSAAGACEMIGSACPEAVACDEQVCGLDPVCGRACGECSVGDSCDAAGTCVSALGRPVAHLAGGATREHNCIVFEGGDADGQVACWGANASGQLGRGDLQVQGDDPGELGAAVEPSDIGTKAVALALGDSHSCAVTESGAVRCWGSGAAGALGRGDLTTIGDQPGELPAMLTDLDLPIGEV